MVDDLNHNLMPQLSHKDMIVYPWAASDPHFPKQMITIGTWDNEW